MFRHLMLGLLLAAAAAAAPPAKPPSQASAPPDEAAADIRLEAPDDILQRELEETGGSPSDVVAVLEKHLQSHADCPKRQEIVRVLALGAVQQQDRARTLKYGVEALDSGADNAKLLAQVGRALLDRTGDPASLRKALDYSTRLAAHERRSRAAMLSSQTYEPNQGRRLDETENSLREALVGAARARSLLGEPAAALPAIDEAWSLCPTVDTALERARVFARLERYSDALDAACDALVIEDTDASTAQRQQARERIAELSARLPNPVPGADSGASPIGGPNGGNDSRLLAAWDRTHAAVEARRARLRDFDPNTSATAPLDFVMTRLDGARYPLRQLQGKVVVFDFWATWCGPCRVQHPLYDVVEARFKSNPDVVFLNLDTDEDRSLVAPFLERVQWSREILFDEGLGSLFRVTSIPTTVVVGRDGQVASRMGGFIPERFVDMLTERINSALAQN